MAHTEVTLVKDCEATRIPSGEPSHLRKGETFIVTQALGGSVTLRGDGALYRLGSEDYDALGPELATALRLRQEKEPAEASEFSEDLVWNALKQCFDPEIPINIVDLGLIYDLRCDQAAPDAYDVSVKMTLTATGCGMGPTIAADAREKIEMIPQVRSAQVDIVWDPQWTPHMISEEGRKVLGLD